MKKYQAENIFSEGELKQKAYREIGLMVCAENNKDIDGALDHAINAAFAVFHLLDWKQKALTNNRTVAQSLRINLTTSLKNLYDVITLRKKVQVSTLCNCNNSYSLEVDSGGKLRHFSPALAGGVVPDSDSPSTDYSYITVYFENEKAISVLRNAMDEFAV